MTELYIVVNDNYGSPSDRISYAFKSRETAEAYADKESKENENNSYHVEQIWLHE